MLFSCFNCRRFSVKKVIYIIGALLLSCSVYATGTGFVSYGIDNQWHLIKRPGGYGINESVDSNSRGIKDFTCSIKGDDSSYWYQYEDVNVWTNDNTDYSYSFNSVMNFNSSHYSVFNFNYDTTKYYTMIATISVDSLAKPDLDGNFYIKCSFVGA